MELFTPEEIERFTPKEIERMIVHKREVCQFGYIHAQCRCPEPYKAVTTVNCDNLEHGLNPIN